MTEAALRELGVDPRELLRHVGDLRPGHAGLTHRPRELSEFGGRLAGAGRDRNGDDR